MTLSSVTLCFLLGASGTGDTSSAETCSFRCFLLLELHLDVAVRLDRLEGLTPAGLRMRVRP
jgi:hypothetical protein